MTKPYVLYDKIKDRYICFGPDPQNFVAYGVTALEAATIHAAGTDVYTQKLTAIAGYYCVHLDEMQAVPVKITVTIDE